ncbi:MAG: hypothetical protein KDA05_01035 [Phycisphaerales bacterium]|nr:hypothetical protein [Phycisphaerales bacterium]MCB9840021.1 hypothetical protein [Phycisphaeraceae bacterium]
MHGREGTLEAAEVRADGVLVRDGGVEYVLGWDRVAGVEGPLGAQAAPFRDLAMLAWRARTRLERGDAVAAEPLYEELFDRLPETGGATALSICEGLLRCRLWRGALASALSPWLQWVALAGDASMGGVPASGSRDDLRSPSPGEVAARIWPMALLPVIDAQTGLVVSLPPVWVPGPSVRALAAGRDPLAAVSGDAPGAERARVLADLYMAAARFEGGQSVVVPVPSQTLLDTDPGVALVADLVLARVGDEAQRERARASLRARLAIEDLPEWQEAWCRAGIGRSLLVEADGERIMQGVVELMHLPARFGSEQAYLTGIALAESAAALRDLGDVGGGETLEQLLGQSYAGHPALEWTELERIRTTPAAPPGASSASQPSVGVTPRP